MTSKSKSLKIKRNNRANAQPKVSQLIQMDSLKPNLKNPRLIRKAKMTRLMKSITDFPKMMRHKPIIIDENNVILAGNMRYKALTLLNYQSIPADWVRRIDDMTDREKKEFMVKDNAHDGEFDFDMLDNDNEWNDLPLDDWIDGIPSEEDESINQGGDPDGAGNGKTCDCCGQKVKSSKQATD